MSTIAPPQAPQMLVSNVIQLVNEGSAPFNMKYGPTQRLSLAPGERIFVNEEVAWHFLGKWWTNNDNPRNRVRQDEYQRLRTLYGAYEDEPTWLASVVHGLAAYTPDGNRVTTVVDDPDGVQGTTATQLGREMSLESQVAVLQDTLLQMQAQIAAQAVRNANDAQPDVPSDPIAPPRAPGVPMPGPTTANLNPAAGVTVPVAPATITAPEDDEAAHLGVFGNALPVNAVVVPLEDPSEAPVEEDAPQAIPHGATGGRIPS